MTFRIEDLQWKDGVALAKTHNGFIVKILSANGGAEYPLVGRWLENRLLQWTRDGKKTLDRDYDLVECLPPEKAKIKVEFWVNVYRHGQEVFYSKMAAEAEVLAGRIACLHITREVEEGEGL